MPEKKITRRQPTVLIPADAAAAGKTHVLAIGVDDYDDTSGFEALETGASAATAFVDCFLDVFQLNGDRSHARPLTSKSAPVPSRGEILKAVRRLAAEASPADRLVVFFSGHARWLADDDGDDDAEGGDLYLAPQDAYADNESDALVSLGQIERALHDTRAGQSLLVLDARFEEETSDPLTERMRARLAKVTDRAVLAAAPGEIERSPNPRLTPFAHHLIMALRGAAPEALERQTLTLASLRGYLTRSVTLFATSAHDDATVLADFSASAIHPDSVGAGGLARALSFRATSPAAVKDFITEASGWKQSEKQIEARVNVAIAQQAPERLGRLTAQLRRAFHWPSSSLSVEGSTLAFPGGSYATAYEADGAKRGLLVHALTLAKEWFGRNEEIANLLGHLTVDPDEMGIELVRKVAPEGTLAGLEAKGWSIESQLADRIEARNAGYSLVIEPTRMRLVGFPPSRGFGASAGVERLAMLIATLDALRTGLS